MTPQLSPTWQRFFAQPALAPAQPQRVSPAGPLFGQHPNRWASRRDANATDPLLPPAAGAAPPARPRPPVDRRPPPPEPPRRTQELTWLTWQMPATVRQAALENLRQTLGWRAQFGGPLEAPNTPVERTRFGLLGEQLVPQGTITVRKTLRAELRETIRTVETTQPRLERNRLVAMHSARLGQLCADLEQRGINALEEVRSGLAWLWD